MVSLPESATEERCPLLHLPSSPPTVLLQHGVGHLVGSSHLHVVPVGGEEVVVGGPASVRLLFSRHRLGTAGHCNHSCPHAQTGTWDGEGREMKVGRVGMERNELEKEGEGCDYIICKHFLIFRNFSCS